MESVYVAWNLFMLFSLWAVPQLLGVLAYFRLRRRHDYLAHLAGFLMPPVLFFFLARIVLVYSYYKAHPDDRCGGALIGTAFIILFGMATQLIFGLIAQLVLHGRHRAGAVLK
jgi:hypothetical protein